MLAKDCRALARDTLKNTWGVAIAMTVIMCLFSALGGASSIPFLNSFVYVLAPVTGLYSFIVLPIILWSYSVSFYYLTEKDEELSLGKLFTGFNYFGKVWVLNFLTGLLCTLWGCLLIVPGIVKAFSYSMAKYILADNPDMRPIDAITESRKLMQGHKGALFCLSLSFIGWFLLSCITCGIGFLWFSPYFSTAIAEFYKSLKPVDYRFDTNDYKEEESKEI